MMPRIFKLLCCLAVAAAALAGPALAAEGAPRVYLEVSPDDEDDLSRLFDTLEGSLEDGLAIDGPVIVVLHGDEARPFTSGAPSPLVDRGARLQAFDLVELRMCETWMTDNGIAREDLPPFVDVVPFAPEEVKRLEDDGYLPFSRVQL